MTKNQVEDDFGVVGKLNVPAFQQRQARQNPSNRRSIHDHVLIFFTYRIYKHFLPRVYNAVRSRSKLPSGAS